MEPVGRLRQEASFYFTATSQAMENIFLSAGIAKLEEAAGRNRGLGGRELVALQGFEPWFDG